ncbi:MAG: radical SAM family heme chaperone HemW [Clostridia bacterium]|nr:radical SAM family heme chaperone HemW [Clostridia bacterium]
MPGLYFHIPFCQKKCGYCDFYSFAPTSAQMDAYKDALCRSVRDFAGDVTVPFDSVYFGGGTPSFFGKERLTTVLNAAKESFVLTDDAEITVECNPGSASPALFRALKKAGVNRVSLGVQSALSHERALLGRVSNGETVKRAVASCKDAGIENISLDLMLGIPAQTPETLDESLAFLLSLSPQHISAYLLKIENGTPLAKQADTLPLPDEDSVCDFYLHTAEVLEQNGLRQYEISNFALPGFESRHNLHYWHTEEYIGLGPAAHSFWGGKRFYFPRDFAAFLRGDSPVPDGEGGGKDEFCMLRLRLTEGLNDRAFFARFGEHLPEGVFAKAKALEPHGLLTVKDGTIALTKQGFLVSNSVIGKLLDVRD